ncbi:cyclic nucleotide-binding domain-containing protein [Aliishimia ponticola]|uniref:Cyclic nucleotide-binding domain-containing protein n=1 Tax=Aliishimia ponticola TaxID=2499833 RepID=A0A4S4NED6_9RHOB|nr:cyclic nucleotide-binding domain-containing protein [Aliishimia ponticola]THH36917.1 cyclic nucleotide-binding domain-containing protein [Aliishimia ponticola]
MPEMNPQPCKTDQSEVLSLFARHSFEQHFQTNSTLLLHGEPADAVYLVASGTVRCCTIDADGSRQIFSFQRKGEVVGITDMDYWHFTAEAVDHVIVKSMPKSILEQELAVNVALRHEIRAWVRGLLAERERQLLMLSKSKGPDRLLHFLQDYAAKRPTSGFVVLPMCRRDIGDHIGLSTEAVSRAFSHLKRAGLIELKSCEKYRIVDDPKGNLAALPNIKPV